MNEDIKFVIKLVIIIIITIVAMTFLINILLKQQCLESYSNYQPQYTLISGCRIDYQGKLTPTDIVREVQ